MTSICRANEILYIVSFQQTVEDPGAPLTYFNDGGKPSDFFGSEILAKSDFFGSMNDAGIFLGHDKKTEGFFWVAKKGLRDFFGVCLKK